MRALMHIISFCRSPVRCSAFRPIPPAPFPAACRRCHIRLSICSSYTDVLDRICMLPNFKQMACRRCQFCLSICSSYTDVLDRLCMLPDFKQMACRRCQFCLSICSSYADVLDRICMLPNFKQMACRRCQFCLSVCSRNAQLSPSAKYTLISCKGGLLTQTRRLNRENDRYSFTDSGDSKS